MNYTKIIYVLGCFFVGLTSNQAEEISVEQREKILEGLPAKDVLTEEQRLGVLANISSSSDSKSARTPFEVPPSVYLHEIRKLAEKSRTLFEARNYNELKWSSLFESKEVHWRALDRCLLRLGIDEFVDEVKSSDELHGLFRSRYQLLQDLDNVAGEHRLYDRLLRENSVKIEFLLLSFKLVEKD